MKLAFEKRYLRDIDDPAIQTLAVEYEPQTVEDAFKYIRDHRKTSYLSINFDLNVADVLAVDFGSHVEFCYIWDLDEANKMEFTSPVKEKWDYSEHKENEFFTPIDEEITKRRFAYDVLYNLKQRESLTYEEAVAIHKILGGN